MQVEMSIKGLMVDPITNMPIVILHDADGQRVLPIWMGVFEANAIALQIENVPTPRPMTHDLLRNVIHDLKADVDKVVVSDLKDNTFYAVIHLVVQGEAVAIDARVGSLEPGKWADFVVYNKDFFMIPQDEIPTVYPLMVVLGGKTVVLRDEWAQELGAPAVGPQIKFLYERPYSFAPDPEEVLKQAEMGG